MPTVLEILQKTTSFLQKKSIENPRLDAEYLLAEVLKCNRLQLYLKFDRPLNEEILNQLRSLVVRRANHEPLQYILKKVPFMNLTLHVDSRALIPRPETEEMVDFIQKLVQEKNIQSILDLGTGTGAIALSLASIFPKAFVTALDKSSEALALAQENAAINQLEAQVCFLKSDWFSSLKPENQFDIIVSNPPYLTEDEWLQAAPEVKDYEPKSALVAANQGLEDLLYILKEALPFLKQDSLLIVETGIHHHAALIEAGQALGYRSCTSRKDLSGRDRFVIMQK